MRRQESSKDILSLGVFQEFFSAEGGLQPAEVLERDAVRRPASPACAVKTHKGVICWLCHDRHTFDPVIVDQMENAITRLYLTHQPVDVARIR
jgi:hypothetical protein